ncbi:hypothetical protein F4553_006945 [Allocatelliglobosispora scoriae]|uniref:Uncharacterized protein n=1 Tax=Allocatelliglobosispora scoriae TaxID=643052 RepID=A0A841C3V5_9ACTN|nr:hypothetical protein [Allocatelliglobosispora scoriae]MBB5873511.1 hypothetical protein [Allocatelliglobosispora scoriae]
MTETRSSGRSSENQSEVMIEIIEAQEAWWPPTLRPLGLGRTRLAWCTIAVESQSTRSEISRRASSCAAAGVGVVKIVLVMDASRARVSSGVPATLNGIYDRCNPRGL